MRDTEIVASIVAGDPDGLAGAYDQYAGPLFKYCRTLLGEHADAADAVRDTFVIAAYRFGRLRDGEPPRAWLYAVARAECHRIARAKKGAPPLDEAPHVSGDRVGAGGRAERAELRALFEAAAAGLSPGEREVVELQLRQGLETDEVATVLGVSRNHALALLARARSQLEACLGVLLVGRSGRGECGQLGTLLAGWDGRLTAALRKRVHRHIERCATCSARRARELRPAMLLDLSPGAALAAGAAESLRLAFGAPSGLRAHTIALATGRGPGAVAHSAAVLARAGAFGKHGFPAPARAGSAGLAGPPGAGRVKALRSPPPRQAVVATAVVIAVAAAAVALALAGNDEHVTVSAGHEPGHPAHPAAGRGPSGLAPAGLAPAGRASARLASFSPAFVHPASVSPPPVRPTPVGPTPVRPALASQAPGSSTSPAAPSRHLTTRR